MGFGGSGGIRREQSERNSEANVHAHKSGTPPTGKWVRATQLQVQSTKYHRLKQNPTLRWGLAEAVGFEPTVPN